MNQKALARYSLFAFLIALCLSAYPIYMGVRVLADMARFGTVKAEDYPKYIIPYTPIALAVLLGIALMPLFLRRLPKAAFAVGTVSSILVFFAAEFCLERLVTVTRTFEETAASTLEGWQMYMCYIPPSNFETRQWTEVNVLMGEYSPAFKLHFYLISVILIVSLLNAAYGFGKMLYDGDQSRKKALLIQAAASVAFLGMCIWACFTAFYRSGEITVSALSAVLMSVFFVLFGVTAGIFVGSFLLQKKKAWSILLPALIAGSVTAVMYIGEMILLNGHLYRFGEGVMFDGLPNLVLAPIDVLVILCAGGVTAALCGLLNRKQHR